MLLNMAPRGLTRLVLVLSAAVAAPPGAVDGTQPDHILDDHFEERPELLPVDDDGGPSAPKSKCSSGEGCIRALRGREPAA